MKGQLKKEWDALFPTLISIGLDFLIIGLFIFYITKGV